MTLAKRLLNHTEGFNVLAAPAEIKELAYVGVQPLRLQYLKGSLQKMNLRLWNVISPKLEGYKYGPDCGFPTLSLQSLAEKGLLQCL